MFKAICGYFKKPIQEENLITIGSGRLIVASSHFLDNNKGTIRSLIARKARTTRPKSVFSDDMAWIG